MYSKQILGKTGEDIACEFLKSRKYTILERNFRCKYGEIDVIAIDIKTKELVFFEVKTRKNLNYGTAAEAVNNLKKKHIYRSAEYYIFLKKIVNVNVRIDIIEVYIKEKNVKVNHIKQII